MTKVTIPKRYKQTEAGMIPADWDVRRIFTLVKHGPKNGYSGRSSSGAKGTPTLSLSATTSGRLILTHETVKYLDEQICADSDLFLDTDDILVQRSNTIALVGTTAVFSGPPHVYVYPDLMMRLRFRDRVSAHWFWRYANSSNGRRYFMSVAAGSTGTMPKISGDKLREMPVPLPPTKTEQEAIAEALNDADALIESLEQLLAKKRQIKQGTMQELLTGKRRLPGFSEQWNANRLGECGEVIMGQSPASFSYNRAGIGSPLINGPTEFTDRHPIKIQWTTQPARFCKAGDLLICVRGSSTGRTNYANDNYAIGRGVAAIRAKDCNDTDYLSYQVISAVSDILAASTGSTFPSVDGASFRKVVVPLPSPAEQRAIANVLSDMNAEIASLETRLAKARQIKQGMMQDLLTGRIRLV